MIYNNKFCINKNFVMYALIAFLFVVTLFVSIDSNIKYNNSWQNFATYDFERIVEKDENGEDKIIYGISTPNQLAGMFLHNTKVQALGISDITFKKENVYRLTQDIDMKCKTWTPQSNFTAIFEGNYFTISNLTIESAAKNVGFVGLNQGTIQNVVFQNINITSTAVASTLSNSASSTGVVAGINNGVIKNITVFSGNIMGTQYDNNNSTRRVGGIVGLQDEANSLIHNCVNYASIQRGKFVGGIVGELYNGTISNCSNFADIDECGTNVDVRVGGIVGRAGTETKTSAVLKLCLNKGNITEQSATGSTNVGGIAGTSWIGITECANYGQIKGGSDNDNYVTAQVGGIAGWANKKISCCYSNANIEAYSTEKTTISNPSILNYGIGESEYEKSI